jgi:hypothetical protein
VELKPKAPPMIQVVFYAHEIQPFVSRGRATWQKYFFEDAKGLYPADSDRCRDIENRERHTCGAE